jgi:hypothetical protein
MTILLSLSYILIKEIKSFVGVAKRKAQSAKRKAQSAKRKAQSAEQIIRLTPCAMRSAPSPWPPEAKIILFLAFFSFFLYYSQTKRGGYKRC